MIINKKSKTAEYSVGSGIVADSDNKDEFRECISKAFVVSRGEEPFSLIETMLWESDKGFFLSDYHIERMIDSAKYFGFTKIDSKYISDYIKTISFPDQEKKRLRLLFNPSNGLSHSWTNFKKNSYPLKISLANTSVFSDNVFLYHKTTNRSQYEQAFRKSDAVDDVILWNEHNQVTEMTIGNIVVQIGSILITPSLNCGLLRGVFRRKLLNDGLIREGIISIKDIKKASKIYRINSVRKWETCELINQTV